MKITAEVYSGADNHAPERKRLAEHIAGLVQMYIRICGLVKRATVGKKSVIVYVFTEQEMQEIKAAFNSADSAVFNKLVSRNFSPEDGWLSAADMAELSTGQLVDYLVQMGFGHEIAKSVVFMSDDDYCTYFGRQPFKRNYSRFDDLVSRIKTIRASE
jgi:hypothetical protein